MRANAKRKGQTIGQNNNKMGGDKRGRGGEKGVGVNMVAVENKEMCD